MTLWLDARTCHTLLAMQSIQAVLSMAVPCITDNVMQTSYASDAL